MSETYGPEPTSFSEPEAVRLRKAGEGALWYGLRRAGWSDEQIHNSLRTHYAGIMDEAAAAVADPVRRLGVGWEDARDVLQDMADTARLARSYRDEAAKPNG